MIGWSVGTSHRCLKFLSTNLRTILPSLDKLGSQRLPKRRLMESRKEYSTIPPYGQRSNMKVEVSGDGASFVAHSPGWSSRDINVQLPNVKEPWHLRGWHILNTIDWIREDARKTPGFLDLVEYENTHFTYYKCADLERVASVEELEALGGLPYQYGITMECFLSRIGKTSFQFENIIKATDTDKPLYRSSLVSVAVGAESREVTPHPDWWVDKYQTKVQEKPSLRVNLPKSHPDGNLLISSPMIVQPLDLDYYGHPNNVSYFFYAMNGILNAHMTKKLAITSKELELSIKRIELDWVSDCRCGDQLDTQVYRDTDDKKALFVNLVKGDKVIYTQKVEYEKDVTFTQKL